MSIFATAIVALALTCAPSEISREAAVDRFFAAYNARDIAGLQSSVAPNAVVRRIQGGEILAEPFADVLTRYRDVVFVRFPGVRIHVVDRMVAGPVVAQVEGVSGFEDNRETGVTVYTIHEGCIVAMDVYPAGIEGPADR